MIKKVKTCIQKGFQGLVASSIPSGVRNSDTRPLTTGFANLRASMPRFKEVFSTW